MEEIICNRSVCLGRYGGRRESYKFNVIRLMWKEKTILQAMILIIYNWVGGCAMRQDPLERRE